MKKIIYTNPDGTVAVVHPARNTRGDEGMTDEEIEQRAWKRLPDGIRHPVFVEPSAIPVDRKYRNAWRQNGSEIVIDEQIKTALDANKPLTLKEQVEELRARIEELEKISLK